MESADYATVPVSKIGSVLRRDEREPDRKVQQVSRLGGRPYRDADEVEVVPLRPSRRALDQIRSDGNCAPADLALEAKSLLGWERLRHPIHVDDEGISQHEGFESSRIPAHARIIGRSRRMLLPTEARGPRPEASGQRAFASSQPSTVDR